uniref:Uncharacterized protein n=1 Tax=Arundo donax TaxID=35708 RepID=A0A0A8Z9B1_ARUDO
MPHLDIPFHRRNPITLDCNGFLIHFILLAHLKVLIFVYLIPSLLSTVILLH